MSHKQFRNVDKMYYCISQYILLSEKSTGIIP